MSNGPKTLALPAGLARILDAVKRRYLAVKTAEFPVLLVGFIALAWLLQGTADRWLELAWGVRAVLLVIDVAVALVLLWFFAIVPLRQRMDRRKAALLVERTLPQFHTALISAVEFSEGAAEYPQGSRPLVEKLLQDAATEAEKQDVVTKVVKTDRLKRFAKWSAAAALLALGFFIYARTVSPILLQRILLSHVALPDDTKVVSVTGDMIVIAGNDAALVAKAEGKIPAAGRLIVTQANGASELIAVSPSRTEEGIFQYVVRNVREPFTYRFELNDGTGPTHNAGVRVPPTLKEIKFVQDYQKYTGLPETEMSPASLRLLAGSKLKINTIASGPLQSAVLEIKGQENVIPLTISGNEKDRIKAELPVPETGWKSMSIHLVAADGDPSVNDPVYRVDLVVDRQPVVQLLQPKKDNITVIAGAKVPFIFKVSDDFGLKRVALAYRVFRPGLGGVKEAAEEGKFPIYYEPTEKAFSRTLEWELSRLVPAVTSGCVINCWIEAQDNNPAKSAVETRSAEKVISIVTEEQKRMELLELLGERAKDVERLYELQRTMNQKTDDSIR